MSGLPKYIKIITIALLAVILSSCAQTANLEPQSDTSLLINTFKNYSVRYPVGYDLAIYSETGLALVKGSLLATDQPRADINIMSTSSMTLEMAVAELVATYPGQSIKQSSIVIDGVPAVMLDAVPGQQVNRIVLLIHNDALIKLNFMPADPNAGETYQEMELLYKTVIESLDFDPLP